jgi:hydrogenase expression/formation protein HypC
MTVGDDTARCTTEDPGCITCGDVAVPLTVVSTDEIGDARCVDDDGRAEVVATDLVGPVAPGDRVLVHAGVAIARVADEEAATA